MIEATKKVYSGPVTPEELDEVFGWVLTQPDCLLVDRVPLKENTAGGILLPEGVRRSRQTGSTFGTIIQIGKDAEEALNDRLSAANRKVAPGDRVSFSVYAPLPVGFLDSNDQPILPGFDSGRYACLELLKWLDVVGHVPKDRIR
jgi:co-chaperonin GroES (HSP10)